ncbi:MAG: GNAT family N-acetyltransferase, partial [Acidimicrobiia bacterium]
MGVAFITPPFLLGLTPMSDGALAALVDVLVERRPHLPGVGGPRDVAGRFAERWRKRTGAGVTPGMEQRLYGLDAVVVPPPAPGRLRPAGEDDRVLLREWLAAFVTETGGIGGDIAGAVDRWLASGGLYLWEDGRAVTMAGAQ